MKFSVSLLLASTFFVAACGAGEQDTEYVEEMTEPAVLTGFSTPESILHDPVADVYLVSNINGPPGGVDDNGFISRVSPDGELLELKWIDGSADDVTLSAPKGMAIVGDRFYVADITAVQIFDRVSGNQIGTITVDGSTFLNDLATGSDGTVYLSDSGMDANFEATEADAVYRLDGETFVAMARGVELGRPNGLLADGGEVWVVTFGSGEMYRVLDGTKADAMTLPTGSLDGIVAAGGRILISSWEGQSVLAGTGADGFEVLVSDVPAPADIGYDARRNRLLIPLFQDDEIRIVPLSTRN